MHRALAAASAAVTVLALAPSSAHGGVMRKALEREGGDQSLNSPVDIVRSLGGKSDGWASQVIGAIGALVILLALLVAAMATFQMIQGRGGSGLLISSVFGVLVLMALVTVIL